MYFFPDSIRDLITALFYWILGLPQDTVNKRGNFSHYKEIYFWD